MKKRILACIVCLCIVLSIAPTIVFAAEERVTSINDNGFMVWSDDGKEFINRNMGYVGCNVIVIDQAGNYNVTGSTEDYRIEIRITDETKAGTVTIVLNGATIEPVMTGAAIGVDESCARGTNVTIVLSENSINRVSGSNRSGILNSGRELKIVGKGTLYATGGYGSAGIGDGHRGYGLNISISDNATVNATGGYNSAGIGGSGFEGNAGNIEIYGNATVNATGGNGAAGIGGGYYGHCLNISIYDNATVYSIGGNGAAGIGGGNHGHSANTSIYGNAKVYSTGGNGAAGIGGGYKGRGSNITISGNPTIRVTSGEYGVGFGSGFGAIGESKTTITGEPTITILNCRPFRDMPDLTNDNCDIYLNDKICDLNNDIFTRSAAKFEIRRPGA